MPPIKKITYGNELLRKLFHLSALVIPVFYYFTSRGLTLSLLVPLTLLVFIVDFSRHHSHKMRKLINLLFGNMLREHEKSSEKKTWSGASPLFLAAVISIAIFPEQIAIAAFTILIVSDSAAALVGRKWGSRKFLGKTFEGFAAFIISAILVIILVGFIYSEPTPFYIAGVISAIIGAIIELYSKKIGIDDNLSIPVGIGLVMWAIVIYL